MEEGWGGWMGVGRPNLKSCQATHKLGSLEPFTRSLWALAPSHIKWDENAPFTELLWGFLRQSTLRKLLPRLQSALQMQNKLIMGLSTLGAILNFFPLCFMELELQSRKVLAILGCVAWTFVPAGLQRICPQRDTGRESTIKGKTRVFLHHHFPTPRRCLW